MEEKQSTIKNEVACCNSYFKQNAAIISSMLVYDEEKDSSIIQSLSLSFLHQTLCSL